MKRLSFLIVAALLTSTGCATTDTGEASSSGEASSVTRQFNGAELPNDPVLQQVRELEQLKVLKNVLITESFPVQITATGPENVLSCLANPNSRWIQEQQECEYMSVKDCNALGGQFNECASPCRNQPGAEMCILMCVPVCDFSG